MRVLNSKVLTFFGMLAITIVTSAHAKPVKKFVSKKPQIDASQFISLNCKSPDLEVGDYCVDSKGKAAVVTGTATRMVIKTLTNSEATLFLTNNANTDGVYAAPDQPTNMNAIAEGENQQKSERRPASVKPNSK